MKRCGRCKKDKPEDQFTPRGGGRKGLQSWCRDCNREDRNSDTGRATRRRWLAADPARRLVQQCRDRAKKTGVQFDITKEDLSLPSHCPVLGLELKYGPGPRQNNSASVDRVNNSLGYVKGNVIVISWRANALKKDATTSELRRLADFYGARDA